MRSLTGWGILVLFLLPVVAADPGDAAFETRALRLRGAIDAAIDDAVLFLPAGTETTISASSVAGRVYGVHALGDEERRIYTVVVHAWTEAILASDAAFTVRADEDAALLAPSALLAGGALDVTTIAESVEIEPLTHASRRWRAEAAPGSFEAAGVPDVVCPQATLLLGAGAIAGTFERVVGSRVDAGSAAAALRNDTFLVLDLLDARVEAPEARLFASAFRADVTGSASIPAATGLVRSGEAWAVAEEPLELEGTFSIEGFPKEAPPPALRLLGYGEGGEARFAIAGSFRSITISGTEVFRAAAERALGGLALTAFALWLYSRIARANALDHPARRRIAERVLAEPGIQQERLQATLGLPWGTFRWHLSVLARSRVLRVERSGRYRHLHPVALPPSARALLAARGRALAVYEFVARAPGASATDAAAALGIAQQLAAYHLKALRRMGLVRREGANPVRWFVESA